MIDCVVPNLDLNNLKAVKLKTENTIEKHKYEMHLQRMRNIKHIIDNRDPKLLISLYLRPTQIALDYKRLKILTLQNLELLERINRIERTQGRTDNYKRDACYRHSHIKNMLRRNKEIQDQNTYLAKKILCVKNEVKTCKELEKEWKFVLKLVEHFSNYPLILPELMQINELDVSEVNKNRPMVYIDLGVKNGRPLGRLVVLLFVDIVPKTVMHFIDLCENHRQRSEVTVDDVRQGNNSGVIKPKRKITNDLCLFGMVFHRIFPHLYLEGGNFNLNKKNRNFRSVPDFPPENYTVTHGCKGTLAMTPNSDGMVNSEFTISLKPLHVLNGKRVAFGKIIKGLNILDVIESYGTKNGKSKKEIQITNCGILKLNLP